MHQCTNAPMHQCTNAPMHQCINAPMHHHKCTNAPMHQCTKWNQVKSSEIKWNMLRYKLLLLKIAIAFSVVWVNSTRFILLYGGDVFVFHMLASQIAISHKENTHMGRLYIFVLGGITFVLFNVRLCGIIFAFSHLLAYCLLCGDMSVNPLLLITHCQDENRQLISFWNEYSWRSVLGGVCCWLFYNKPWFVHHILLYFIFICKPKVCTSKRWYTFCGHQKKYRSSLDKPSGGGTPPDISTQHKSTTKCTSQLDKPVFKKTTSSHLLRSSRTQLVAYQQHTSHLLHWWSTTRRKNISFHLLRSSSAQAKRRAQVACPAGGTPAGLLLHHQVVHLMMQHISTTCGGTPQVVVLPLRIPMQLKAALVWDLQVKAADLTRLGACT